jgi:DNA polymerase-3 subunit gamma/tau
MSPALPLLPVRAVGDSDAATAGARIGAATPAADGHDPSFILAALGRVAGGIAAEPADVAAPEIPVPRDAVAADSVTSGGLRSPGADSWEPAQGAAPPPAQPPAAAPAAGVTSAASAGPATRSSRRLLNWETTATIVAVVILVVILLAIFA